MGTVAFILDAINMTGAVKKEAGCPSHVLFHWDSPAQNLRSTQIASLPKQWVDLASFQRRKPHNLFLTISLDVTEVHVSI